MNKSEKKLETLKELIINYFGFVSINGQERLLNDLKRTNSQLMCCKFSGSKTIEKNVKKIGVPRVELLKKKIIQHSYKIDKEIKWENTMGKGQDIKCTRLAFQTILNLSQKIFDQRKKIEEIDILLKQLKGNKFSIIRSIAPVKFKSINPGSMLVGKQTKNSNNRDVGFVDEHILPTNYLIESIVTLISKGQLNKNKLDIMLDKYFIVKLNTDDDYLIKNSGFSKSMPKDWNILSDDPFIRYLKSGIDINSIVSV
jgi:hypothetical protein